MATKKIDKAEWGHYFNAFSKQLMGGRRLDYAEVRVFSPEIGAQPETRWLPLKGITYDHKNDLLDVALENLDHLIYHPDEIYVDEVEEGILSSLEVIRKDGTHEIIEVL